MVLYCTCKSNSHTDKNCRKNQSNNMMNNTSEMAKVVKNTSDFHTFQFRVDDCNSFLVDTGATSHIANDESMFIDFDPDFNPDEHFLELADGTKQNSKALKRGMIAVTFVDSGGISYDVTLHELYA